jgi:hypothetical protein
VFAHVLNAVHNELIPIMTYHLMIRGLVLSPILVALACSGKISREGDDIDSRSTAGAASGGDASATDYPRGGSNFGGAAGSNPVDGTHVAGTGGSKGNDIDVVAGAAGADNDTRPSIDCPSCTIVADDQDVHAVFVAGDQVYWLDYGKYDELGNYSYNGRLLARNISGGAERLIVDALPGPIQLSINGDYAYVLVEQRTEPNFERGLLRIALSGGTPQVISKSSIHDSTSFPSLSAAPSYEYWQLSTGIWRAANSEKAPAEVVSPMHDTFQIVNDDTTLFFKNSKGVWSMPLIGGDPTQIGPSDSSGLAVSGSYLYSVEGGNKSFLLRMPKTGGSWTRVARFDRSFNDLAVYGDHLLLFGDSASGTGSELYQARLSAPAKTSWLLTDIWSFAWAMSDTGVFYGDHHGLHFAPF